MSINFKQGAHRLVGSAAMSLLAGMALAQSPPPTQPTDPSAASSPHQRDAVKSPGAEAPAPSDTSADASTSHQKQVLKKKKHHAKPAKDTETPTP